jgi:hypothetical protein
MHIVAGATTDAPSGNVLSPLSSAAHLNLHVDRLRTADAATIAGQIKCQFWRGEGTMQYLSV